MNGPNVMALFTQFMRNPAAAMANSKFNIPKEIQNDPNAIIKHLMSSGQMSQDNYNKARQMASMLFPQNK